MEASGLDGRFDPIQTSVHLLIPIYIHNLLKFRSRLLKSREWDHAPLETGFYLRYVDTIFFTEKDKASENPLTSKCLVMENNSFKARLTVRKNEISLEKARVFCFDTSVGLLDLHMIFSCNCMEDVANVCARLRQTELVCKVRQFDPGTDTCLWEHKTTVSGLADQLLSPLGEYTLFDHVGPRGIHRAELLASVIIDAHHSADVDSLMYRIAEGIDMRSEDYISADSPYCPLPHIRWAITRKGACNVGLLTENNLNRQFVLSKWHDIISNRHMIWYVIVLHQKYVIYHYLNDIAQIKSPSDLKTFQRKIMAFNTEYRFEVIADDPSYQLPYEKTRDAKSVEQIFSDIDEEIHRIHAYHDAVRDKNNGVAMTIVSLVCAISTFIDIFSLSLLEKPLYEAMQNLSVPQVILYGITICAMGVALGYLVVKPMCKKIFEWIKSLTYWLLKLLLTRKEK